MDKRRSAARAIGPTVAMLARAYLGIVFSLALWATAPFLFGWQPTVVTSGSMEPLIQVGDVVAAQPVTAEDIAEGLVQPGHVILAENPARPGSLITHRVIRIEDNGDFITKGDRNPSADSTPIPVANVKGIERLRVPIIGLPLQAAWSGNPLPAALFILVTAAAQLVVADDRRRDKENGDSDTGLDTQGPAVPTPAGPALVSGVTALSLTVLLVAAPAATATFTGTTAPPTSTVAAASLFPVPGISAKTLRFGVAEPNASTADLDLVSREVNEYPSYLQWYQDFGSTFDMTRIAATRAKGVTPIITWEPWIAANGVNQPAYRLSALAAGDHDAYMGSVADQLIAAGNPAIYIRFAHEMNGNWYPWSESANGNASGQYVTAWRHVVDLFKAKGVTNVEWVWAPNIPYSGSTPMSGLYPGTAYVTRTGIDGFNFGSKGSPYTWVRPWDIFGSGLGALAYVAPDKNILITETASTETEGANSKATWISDVVYYLNHWGDGKAQRVEGFIWFDMNKETNWRIDSSDAARQAMRSALATR
jgi:signal peptidase I